MNNICTVEKLKKVYFTRENEIFALDNFSFNFKEGEIVAIVGPSGCGKSTILNLIAELIEPTGGKVDKKEDLTIGYMFQTDCLFPFITIYQNAILGLSIKDKLDKEHTDYVNKLLKEYDLYEFRDNYPTSLSGGMKQRVSLIRTLAINPDLLLLDEPFSALDYQTRIKLVDDVYEIIKRENKSTILVTHNIEEAISLADKVIILSKRPSTIKEIIEINIDKTKPSLTKLNNQYNDYYRKIWDELNES